MKQSNVDMPFKGWQPSLRCLSNTKKAPSWLAAHSMLTSRAQAQRPESWMLLLQQYRQYNPKYRACVSTCLLIIQVWYRSLRRAMHPLMPLDLRYSSYYNYYIVHVLQSYHNTLVVSTTQSLTDCPGSILVTPGASGWIFSMRSKRSPNHAP